MTVKTHTQRIKHHAKRKAPTLVVIGLLVAIIQASVAIYFIYLVESKFSFVRKSVPHAVDTAPPEQQAQNVIIQWLNKQEPKEAGATALCSAFPNDSNRFNCTAKKFAYADQPEQRYLIEVDRDGKEWKGVNVKAVNP